MSFSWDELLFFFLFVGGRGGRGWFAIYHFKTWVKPEISSLIYIPFLNHDTG